MSTQQSASTDYAFSIASEDASKTTPKTISGGSFIDDDVATSTDTASFSSIDLSDRPQVEIDRQKSPVKADSKRAEFVRFREICQEMKLRVAEVRSHLVDGLVEDEGLTAILHIEDLLEQLFDCRWGHDDSLKRIVVAIETQVKNVEWSAAEIDFLDDFLGFLSTRYVIDESTVEQCFSTISDHELDPFRGTISEPKVAKKFKIIEINE